MSRGKPQQQIYRPGSGPLRKSNNFLEDSESDTNLVISSKQRYDRDAPRFRSEGNSPRDRGDLSNMTSRMDDLSLNRDPDKDGTRRNRKPEQELYVPRPALQARATQDSGRNTYSQANGHEQRERGSGRGRYFSDRKPDSGQREWSDNGPGYNRFRQGSEPRGMYLKVVLCEV